MSALYIKIISLLREVLIIRPNVFLQLGGKAVFWRWCLSIFWDRVHTPVKRTSEFQNQWVLCNSIKIWNDRCSVTACAPPPKAPWETGLLSRQHRVLRHPVGLVVLFFINIFLRYVTQTKRRNYSKKRWQGVTSSSSCLTPKEVSPSHQRETVRSLTQQTCQIVKTYWLNCQLTVSRFADKWISWQFLS